MNQCICMDKPGECDCAPDTLPPPRTCESLGVCQNPLRECTGACEKTPRIHAWEPTDPTQPVQGFTVESYGHENFVTCLLVAALSGATLGILYGAGRWAWQAYQAWAVLA